MLLQFLMANILQIQFAPPIARVSLLFVGLCASGLAINLLSDAPARALTVTNSKTFLPVLQVDNGSGATGLDISGLGVSVTNVSLSVTLTKCGGSFKLDPPISPIGPSGACNSSDFSYNSEIQLYLLSPSRIYVPNGIDQRVQMVYQEQLDGQSPGGTVTWNFQDTAPALSPLEGNLLEDGYFQPYQPFSLFNGENPNGTWTLYYEDTGPNDPLSINSWSISVTDSSTPADVPGPLPLFGLAAAFGWSRLLRKRIRARRDLRSGS